MTIRHDKNIWFISLIAVVLGVWLVGCGEEAIMVTPDSSDQTWGVEESWEKKLDQLLVATNVARAVEQDCGEFGKMPAVAAVKRNSVLDDAAWMHAEDMVYHNFFSHEGSDGSRVTERVASANYPGIPVGENLAATYRSPEGVVQGWLDSDSHCRILMSPHAVEAGFAVLDGDKDNDYAAYWVQVFGRQSPVEVNQD